MNKPVTTPPQLDAAIEVPPVVARTNEGGTNRTSNDVPVSNADLASHFKIKKMHSARIEHRIPGRIRVKISSARNNSDALNLYKSIFSELPGISKVIANVETGSIVIQYDPRREAEFQDHFQQACQRQNFALGVGLQAKELDDLANKIEGEALFLADRSEVVRVLVDVFKNVDYQIKVVTGNKIDLKVVLVGALAAFTFVEIGGKAATPMWVTLALFSLNHFIELRHDALQDPLLPAALGPH